MELERGRVAVVAGGGGVSGLALAERLARAGLDLVLADLRGYCVDLVPVHVDVSSDADVQDLAERTACRAG